MSSLYKCVEHSSFGFREAFVKLLWVLSPSLCCRTLLPYVPGWLSLTQRQQIPEALAHSRRLLKALSVVPW